MTIENNDILLVNRNSSSYHVKFEKIKDSIKDEVNPLDEAPLDGDQYGRQSGGWTPIVHTPEYTDDDVDAHLNRDFTVDAGQLLSWDGGDYKWIEPSAGGGGGGNPNIINYQYPSGQQRTLQSRLEDYVSVKDFGAVGDGTTDDTNAVRAALTSGAGGVYFPKGTYRVTDPITLDRRAVRMFGDGTSASIFLVDPDQGGTASAIIFKYDFGGDNGQCYSVADMSILCQENKTAAAGLVLEFTGADSGQTNVIGQFNKLMLNNVNIGSEFTNDANTGHFKIGLYLINSAGVVGNNVNIFTNAKDKVEYGDEDSKAIEILNTRDNHFMIRTLSLTNVYLQRYHTALKSTKLGSGGNIESIYISQGEVLAAKGFEINDGDAVYLSGLHMDVRDYAIRNVSYGGVMRIIGCDIRGGRDGSENDTTQDFLMELRSNYITVNGCNIMAQRATRGVIITGGQGRGSKDICISGNFIQGNDQSNYLALKVDNGSENIVFGGNCMSRFGGRNRPIEDDTNGSQLFIFGTQP